MLRSWWLPWVLVLTLLLGIGAPEIFFYLSNYRPLSWDYLYSFGPDPLPVSLIGEDRRVQIYRFRPDEPLQVLVMRQDVPGIERCAAGAGFERWFRLLERVASEGPAETNGHGTEGWASLTVGDEMADGSWQGVQFEVHIPRGGNGPVIVERDGVYHEVEDANAEAWSLIWSGCTGLGARSWTVHGMNRTPVLVLLLAAVVLAGCEDECFQPGWGRPLSYMAAADVREMLVSGSDRKLYAYRSAAGEPFEIAIAYKAGGRIERCQSGPGFLRVLDAMASVQVIRRSWHDVYPTSSEWFVVELWPAGSNHGTPHRLRPPVPGYPWSVMQWCFGSQFLVDIDPAVWESLRSGCASLGADAAGGA